MSITFDKTSQRLTVHDVTNLFNRKKSDDNYASYFINSIHQLMSSLWVFSL
jgi:hypothetical protein